MADFFLAGHHFSQTAGHSTKNSTSFARDRKVLFLKAMIGILSVFLITELCYYLFFVSLASAAHVEFSGVNKIFEKDLLLAAGLQGEETWSQINEEIVMKNIMRHPLVAQASIKKVFPDKVFINVVQRLPVAVMFSHVNGKLSIMEVDKTGTVFRIGNYIGENKLPIVSGLRFQNPTIGMKVHEDLTPVFSQLDVLARTQLLLLNEISEIKIDEQKFGNYDLIVYPMRVPVKVRMSKNINEKSLQYMMLVLDVLTNFVSSSSHIAFEDIEELDIRSGNAVIKRKGIKNE